MSYHGDGVDHKETLFNVGEKLYFSADVEEYDDEVSSWRPYMTNDMQVELVMLDPWVRTSLVKGQGSSYVAEFYVFFCIFRLHLKRESTSLRSTTENPGSISSRKLKE